MSPSLDAAEVLLSGQEHGASPPPSHVRILPALHVVTQMTSAGQTVLNTIGAAQDLTKITGDTQTMKCESLFHAFSETGRCRWIDELQFLGQLEKLVQGFLMTSHIPRSPEFPPDQRMIFLRKVIQDIPLFVNMTPLDLGAVHEDHLNALPKPLGPINHEQVSLITIKSSIEQIL